MTGNGQGPSLGEPNAESKQHPFKVTEGGSLVEQIDQNRWIVGDDVVDSQSDQGRHSPGVVDGPDMNLSARVALTNFIGRLPLLDLVVANFSAGE